MSERYITVDKGKLIFYDNDGENYEYDITSGWVGYTDYTEIDKAPIPPGCYYLYPGEITCGLDGRWLVWKYYYNQDWGKYRVPLHPLPTTKLYKRGDFFLHGGEKPGSAGCIDIGPADIYLFPKLLKSFDKILVYVSENPV